MKAKRQKITISKAHADACPKCGRHSLVDSHWVISVTFDSIISGVLSMMSVLWVGFYIGVDRNISIIAGVCASIPFVFSLIKKKVCRNCEIEFTTRGKSTDDDFEEIL